MSTLAKRLRITCEANDLGVSGWSTALMTRPVKGGDKDKKRRKDKKRTKNKEKRKTATSKKKTLCKNGVCASPRRYRLS